ncbi:MAG TPA: hypothetical protein VJ372_09690 [Pyrinomonadaceae bacterium]|nr:hypothetical protein [Pyrinomonadaceae bacterium]
MRLVSQEVDDAWDEKKNVSKVQAEPDGVFYSTVAGVAREYVGRR